MAFYEYEQNNSGGSFHGDYYVVFVEAPDADTADAIATSLGNPTIYFGGVAEGMDCECCGDRWSPAWGDGDERPELYGKSLGEVAAEDMWDLKALVVYADGRREEFPGAS